MYFGSNYDSVPVIWDTGSEWPLVLGHTCDSSCSGHTTYDYSAEDGVTFFEIANSEGQRNYGSVSTEGFEARDWVCLASGESGSCVTNQHIFVATEQVGLPTSIGGIIGLGTDADDQYGPNYIKSLHTSGALTDQVFAFYFNSDAFGSSFIDIGVIDESHMSDSNDLVTLNVVEEDFWWSNYVTGIKFGDDSNEEWGLE